MAKLLSKQALLTVADGGVQDGTPTYGSATDIKCLTRSVKISKTETDIDLAALCDDTTKRQVLRLGGELDIEIFIDDAPLFESMIGHYVRLSWTPKTGGTPLVYDGVINRWDGTIEIDQAQIERIGVMLGVA